MANINMTFDMSDFLKRSGILQAKLEPAKMIALGTIADEILRLSQREVPFRTGELMNSGTSKPFLDHWVVGYNKVYAAYMHEGSWFDGSHVVRNYRNGRKGHYLIDPILVNKPILQDHFGRKLKQVLMAG